jgi:hypothetical protein
MKTIRQLALSMVLNTDNMSMVNLTIDYGPFGFILEMALGKSLWLQNMNVKIISLKK